MNKLSDFERFEEIGHGKQTVVYRGHQISLDRPVAIKCLKESAKTDPRKLELFVRQSRFLANFSHLHLITVVSVDKQQGWLVMELMQGSLESCLNANDLLSANDARTVIKQALDALDYIHGRGYLHGLIRPSNILIDSTEGVAKLGDFEEIDLKSGIASRSKDFKYLAPELLDSNKFGPIGPQLDLYNLGFSIFEAMVGSDAARRIVGIGDAVDPETAWMRWHQSPEGYPPMKQVIPNIPNDLAQFLDVTLKKSVHERPGTAEEALKIVDKVNLSDSISESLVEHIKLAESDPSPSGQTSATTLQTQRELLPGNSEDSDAFEPTIPASATLQASSNKQDKRPVNSKKDKAAQPRPTADQKNWQGSSNKSKGKSLSLNDKRVFYPIAGVVLVLAAIIGFMLQGENESDTEMAVRIETQLEDVQFYIGDEKVDAKPSKKLDGAYVMQLEKGKVELTARKQGYKDFTKEIDVSESEHIFEFKLTQLKKLVEIATNPADAMIKLDGKELEPGENGKFAFPVGDYQLSFAADGYQDKTVDLSVIDGENEPVVVELKRSAVMVSIKVTPDDAVIAWNDTEHQGTDGLVEFEMPIGQHLIEISRDGCATMTESIEVALEEIAGFEFELPMVVQSKITPADAEVWINGELAEADLIDSDTYHLKSGTYNIELKKEGFKPLAMNLSIGPDQENVIQGSMIQLASVNSSTSPNSDSKQPPSLFNATKGASSEEAGLAQKEWAKYLGQDVEIENELGMEFMLVPPGEFMMGSPVLEQGRDHDEQSPPQLEKIKQAFYLGKHEVTQKQWFNVMGTEPWLVSKGKPKPQVETGDDIPASYISWNDAVEFCQRLSKIDGIEYRLPTEKEWEYSCRAGTTTTFSCGNDKSKMLKFAQYREDNYHTRGFARPVGQKIANAWSFHDMHGNVWEWCSDTYSTSGYEVAKVRRGGSWNSSWRECRSANRSRSWSNNFALDPTEGFRVVRVFVSENESKNGGGVAESNSIENAQSQQPEKESPGLFYVRNGTTKSDAVAAQRAWSKYLESEVEIENTINMQLVLIPPGQFKMGSSRYEEGRDKYESPLHEVRISSPFYLGKYEVTQDQWFTVMGTRPWMDKMGKPKVDVKTGAEYPATYINWHDAAEFCKKLSEIEGVEYRLPTEAEWEYACRGGTTTKYHFGESGLGKYAWYTENSFDGGAGYAHRVGEKQKNVWGLYDIHGNVWEWCSDWFDSETYSKPTVNDPNGPEYGAYKVYRGGSWYFKADYCRSAARFWSLPGNRAGYVGFRVVRTIENSGK